MPRGPYFEQHMETDRTAPTEGGANLPSSRRLPGLPMVALCLAGACLAAYLSWLGRRPMVFDHIPIRGTKEFKEHVVAALGLLKTRSPGGYTLVTNYIGAFEQSAHTGMAPWDNPPTSYLHDKFSWESAEDFAGGIAHESYHSKLYYDALRATNVWGIAHSLQTEMAVPKYAMPSQHYDAFTCASPDVFAIAVRYTPPTQTRATITNTNSFGYRAMGAIGACCGEEAERLCTKHQVRVLKEIGASPYEVEYYATWPPKIRWWEIPVEKVNW